MLEEKKLHQGIIKFFSYKRGYGFIIPEDPAVGEDVFFHFSAISNIPGMIVYLIPTEQVSFELLKGPRGYLANNVTSKNKLTAEENPPMRHKTDSAKKVGTIYQHYYYSLKKIMDNLVQDSLKDTENTK